MCLCLHGLVGYLGKEKVSKVCMFVCKYISIPTYLGNYLLNISKLIDRQRPTSLLPYFLTYLPTYLPTSSPPNSPQPDPTQPTPPQPNPPRPDLPTYLQKTTPSSETNKSKTPPPSLPPSAHLSSAQPSFPIDRSIHWTATYLGVFFMIISCQDPAHPTD